MFHKCNVGNFYLKKPTKKPQLSISKLGFVINSKTEF